MFYFNNILPYIVAVAIKTPLYSLFDYLTEDNIAIGSRVKVNFAAKEVVAIVVKHKKQSEFKLKSIIKIIDKKPIISKDMFAIINWASVYYKQPIGEMLFASIPKKLRIGVELKIKKSAKKIALINKNITINTEQQVAIDKILQHLNNYQAFLLHGVTGSGKTEVYLQVAQQVLANKQQILVLVPEIGLTPQMIDSFASRLDTKVVAVHSALNATQKLDAYLSAKNTDVGVVLGTRSAVWTQMSNLGLIIIDEEHDDFFKQNSTPRYNAKNIAFMLAKNNNIPIILGSATPSLESIKNTIDKKLYYLSLKNRVSSAKMPNITIIDSKNEVSAISTELHIKIKQHLTNQKQVLLFINRRGYAPIYFCTSCNHQVTCSSCDKPMIYHLDSHKLKCHHCEKVMHPMQSCDACGNNTLQVLGYGTQRLEENLSANFAKIDIIRIDRDSTTKKSAFKKKLAQIKSGKPCIIVGTQMLAKGHDFANITLVGVLNVDGSLLSGNFRALENLSQLLIQVSGRAGRAKDLGEVVIQTNYPNNSIFSFIKKANYIGFAKYLLKQRYDALMPPFSYQALICANSKNANKAKNYLVLCKQVLNNITIDEISIFDVVPANIIKKADYYYYNLHIYSVNRNKLNILLNTFIKHLPKSLSGVRFYIDIDPYD